MASESDSLQTVERGLHAVETLIREPRPLSVREIAEKIGINRTTAHRLVNTLQSSGWIERAPDGGYQISVKFLALGHVANDTRPFLSEIRADLLQLSQRSRETVHVGVLDGYEVLHVDKIESLERVGVSSRIGTRGNIFSTSLGLALLAALSDERVREYMAAAAELPEPLQLADPDAFLARLEAARERGYSLDDEVDSIGVRCIGAAVRGPGGRPLFAISLTGPSPRFTRVVCEGLGPELVAAAAGLSNRFGYRPESAEVAAA